MTALPSVNEKMLLVRNGGWAVEKGPLFCGTDWPRGYCSVPPSLVPAVCFHTCHGRRLNDSGGFRFSQTPSERPDKRGATPGLAASAAQMRLYADDAAVFLVVVSLMLSGGTGGVQRG